MTLMENPPKLVYDSAGHLIEVIFSADDYRAYLRDLVQDSDWETLPAHLQDAIDQLMIEEVRNEKEDAVDLDSILSNE